MKNSKNCCGNLGYLWAKENKVRALPGYIYQALQVLDVTYGWSLEGLFEAECIPHAKIHWLSVSAKEWMASENMEAEPEYAHPITFNTKLTAFLEKK